jgi:hypothetical protein
MKKGKEHDQAVAIALSKKDRGEIIAEAASIDKDYLKNQGIDISTKLGQGMFGVVYEVNADIGEGKKKYALKFVSDDSKGYSREKSNYKNVKQFVELANIRQDAEAMQLSKMLPIIYSVSEHNGGLYIIMEKLFPLSDEEKNFFMSEISGLAYYYTQKGQQGRGEQLYDYIIDRNGKIPIKFDGTLARAVVKGIARAPEFSHLKEKIDFYANKISRIGSDADGKKLLFSAVDSNYADELRIETLEALYSTNRDFKRFLNGIGYIIKNEYKNVQNDTEEEINDFMGMLLNQLYEIIFSQRYPMQYVDKPEFDSPFNVGHGESSSIYDLDIDANPKMTENKEKYSVAGVKKNPTPKSKDKQGGVEPKKYPFDPFIDAVRKLGRDWNIKAKDMHNANVMKRANGQYVVADIGLFNTKIIQSMKSGIFESKKRVIKVKII